MNSIELFSAAKINLSIDVLGKRPDGYHEVEMILQEVDLSDIIRIEKRQRGIELGISVPYLPTDDRNMAYKAAYLFFEHTGINAGAGITLEKNIPVSAGLGGGSSNAAYVLIGLDKLFETGLSAQELKSLSARLGSDVPFFIEGGTAVCRGRGEITQSIETETMFDLLIVKPDISVSTKDIYMSLDTESIKTRPLTENLIDALRANDSITVSKHLVNVLETVTFKIYPEIKDLKVRITELGALNSLMSGSGSAVFGIFRNKYDALLAADKLPDGKYKKYVVRTKVR